VTLSAFRAGCALSLGRFLLEAESTAGPQCGWNDEVNLKKNSNGPICVRTGDPSDYDAARLVKVCGRLDTGKHQTQHGSGIDLEETRSLLDSNDKSITDKHYLICANREASRTLRTPAWRSMADRSNVSRLKISGDYDFDRTSCPLLLP
jgi:hypothetical protein